MAKRKYLIGIDDLKKLFSSDRIVLDDKYITDGYIVINIQFVDALCLKLLRSFKDGDSWGKFYVFNSSINVSRVFPKIKYLNTRFLATKFFIKTKCDHSAQEVLSRIYFGETSKKKIIISGVNTSLLGKLSAFNFFDEEEFVGCESPRYNKSILVSLNEENEVLYGIMPMSLTQSEETIMAFFNTMQGWIK